MWEWTHKHMHIKSVHIFTQFLFWHCNSCPGLPSKFSSWSKLAKEWTYATSPVFHPSKLWEYADDSWSISWCSERTATFKVKLLIRDYILSLHFHCFNPWKSSCMICKVWMLEGANSNVRYCFIYLCKNFSSWMQSLCLDQCIAYDVFDLLPNLY